MSMIALKKNILMAVLLLFLFGQNLKAQFVAFELGYSPIASVLTSDFQNNLDVFTIGVHHYISKEKVNYFSLDYGFGSSDYTTYLGAKDYRDDNYANVNYKSSIIKVNFSRYRFLVGGLDKPFQWYGLSGFSFFRDYLKGEVYEKEKYFEEDVKEIENGVNVFHFNIMIGTGFQYNLNRQIGIRTDFNLGYGITNGYGVSAFVLPKISLCYKPDRLK